MGGGGIIYLSLHSVTTRMTSAFSLEMGSDESHFNVSLSRKSDGQSHKTVSTNHNLRRERRRAEQVSRNRGPSA